MVAVGFTHMVTVKVWETAVVGKLTKTKSSTPSKRRALPTTGAEIRVAPLRVPAMLPVPKSKIVDPLASLKVQ
jgi:hypothetical protein